MTTPPENNEADKHKSVTEMKNRALKIWKNKKELEERLPIRIPESLRAIGTEGFKISSLQKPAEKSKLKKHSKIKTNLTPSSSVFSITKF